MHIGDRVSEAPADSLKRHALDSGVLMISVKCRELK